MFSEWLKEKFSKLLSDAPARSHSPADGPGFTLITFEMMQKGAIIPRRGGKVRQIGVMVDGSVRLVTSGDRVDRETYEALVQMGAVLPPARERGGVGESGEE